MLIQNLWVEPGRNGFVILSSTLLMRICVHIVLTAMRNGSLFAERCATSSSATLRGECIPRVGRESKSKASVRPNVTSCEYERGSRNRIEAMLIMHFSGFWMSRREIQYNDKRQCQHDRHWNQHYNQMRVRIVDLRQLRRSLAGSHFIERRSLRRKYAKLNIVFTVKIIEKGWDWSRTHASAIKT